MLELRLLGGLDVDAGLDGVEVPTGRPARLLLGWLAAHPGEHARAEVAARLWPDVLDTSARASLRTALSELRAALGPAAAHLLTTRETVGLGGEGLRVDLRVFAELVAERRLEEALELCRGEALAGLDEEWVLELRSRHVAERAEAALALARPARERGDAGAALRWARRLAAWDPLDETAQRELMLALAAAGDRAAAVRAYEDFRRRLARELRLTPSAATRELASALRREELAPAGGTPTQLLPPRLEAARRGVFAGRRTALVRLHQALALAERGERCIALVTGEPGIGKTRILAEFAHAAGEAGALVLYGRCEDETSVPYLPFAEALAPLPFGGALTEGLERPAAARPGEPAADPEAERLRLFDAVAEQLEELTTSRPLVLVLDDLHWAERATLLLLRRLATRPQRARLLVLGSARESHLRTDHPLAETLAGIRRDRPVARVELHGLDEAAIAAVWQGETATNPDARSLGALREQTGGNPFFIGELLRHPEALAGGRPPDSVREVVWARAGRLPERARRVLELAAVAGQEFDAELLQIASGLQEEDLLDALDDVLRAGLVRELSDGRLAFPHALTRAALAEELSGPRRARLHRRVASALTERALRSPERWLAPLAHHALAGAGEDPEPALSHALDAAALAVRRLAWEDAVALLERAEALARTSRVPGERLAEVLVALGGARLRAGAADASRAAFDEAARLAAEAARDDLLAGAALGAAGLGVTIVSVDEPLVELLEQALAALEPGRAELRVRLLSRLAIALAYAPAEERRRALADEAVAAARALDDPGALAVALTASHVVHWAPEHLDVRLAAADELVALGRRSGESEIELHGRHWRVVDLLERGDVAAATDELGLYERLAGAARLPAFSWYGPAWRAALAAYRGELADAERLSAEALAQGVRVGDGNAERVLVANQYTLRVVREAWEEFDLEQLRARIASPAGPAYRAHVAHCLAELGHVEAAALIVEAHAEGFARMPRDGNLLIGLTQLAEACAAAGDADRAADVVPLLEPFADRMVVLVRATGLVGSIARPLGRALAAAGRAREAIDAFEAAIAADRARGGRPFVARAQRDLAETLLARGAPADARRARALLEEAAATAEQLRLREPEQRARALLQAAAPAPAP